MEERGLIITKTRYALSAKPAEDADRRRAEPVLSPSEPTENGWNPTSYEVPYNMANQEVTGCFNDLARAMREFSESYNAGHVIHVRDVINYGTLYTDWRSRSGSIPRFRISAAPAYNRGRKDMNIFKISDKGLCVVGVLVAVLWGIIVAHHLILRSAQTEAMRTMRRIKSLQMQDHSRYSSPWPHASSLANYR